MNLNGRKLSIMMLTATLMLAFAFAANATGMGGGGGMGGAGNTGTMANHFSGFGTVVSIDTADTPNTITVDLTMASRLLTTDIGTPPPTTVTFQVSAKAWIGSMVMGGMMSQSGAGASSMMGGGTRLKLSDIKQGDEIALMGHFDSTATPPYIIDRLFDWLY